MYDRVAPIEVDLESRFLEGHLIQTTQAAGVLRWLSRRMKRPRHCMT
jgi:hypothetical protein